ncbi:MAG: MoaD/ThiS family protein [Helicobacteraceae bacterium]|jgi:molybdopterin synthase sulfur carrier subunit|nr:MoaD/ThiS family protein [Helicobacteraceae bacterium]
MVKVEFLGPIGKKPIEADVSNLNELASLLAGDEALGAWLDKCAVAVNDEIVSSRDRALKDGDKIALLPPVCGG